MRIVFNASSLQELERLPKNQRRELYLKALWQTFRDWQVWLSMAVGFSLPIYLREFGISANHWIVRDLVGLIAWTSVWIVLQSFTAKHVLEERKPDDGKTNA